MQTNIYVQFGRCAVSSSIIRRRRSITYRPITTGGCTSAAPSRCCDPGVHVRTTHSARRQTTRTSERRARLLPSYDVRWKTNSHPSQDPVKFWQRERTRNVNAAENRVHRRSPGHTREDCAPQRVRLLARALNYEQQHSLIER